MSKKPYTVAVVGATGAVGEAVIHILAERDFPVKKLYALASEHSVGEAVLFRNQQLPVEDLATFDFANAQLVFFCAGSEVSANYVPIATAKGCIVIDNSSYFRYEPDVPLIVPEVNPEALLGYGQRNIIANPNCSSIQLVVALKPIYDVAGIERINIATYQSVSGAGQKAIHELASQTASVLNGLGASHQVFPQQIAFNVLPQIDIFQENGYTREEMKMVWETRKILNDEAIQINSTAVRVPVFYGHAEAVHIETKHKLTAQEARELLQQAHGVVVMDKQEVNGYPTPVSQAAGEDGVFVGRIREDISHPRGLNFWIVSDNLRKGAALNAVQIAELLQHLP